MTVMNSRTGPNYCISIQSLKYLNSYSEGNTTTTQTKLAYVYETKKEGSSRTGKEYLYFDLDKGATTSYL